MPNKQTVADRILQNAVDSISLGIEDYQLGATGCKSSDPRRLISCTRNLFAGIMLIFKHKLAKLSPSGSDEVLIKQRIIPTQNSEGDIEWQGKGGKTVDVQEIQNRFQTLNIHVDWNRIEAIREYRNNIEHYFSSKPHNSVSGLITECFIVIHDFIRDQLKMDPLELFQVEIWNVLTEIAEVYNREKQKCVEQIKSIDCESNTLKDALIEYRCEGCNSGLIGVENQEIDTDIFDAKFRCRSCRKIWDFELFVNLAVPKYFSHLDYRSIKDGGGPVFIPCPECNLETYVLEEDKCIVCGESVNWHCWRCGQTIPPEEMEGDELCSFCRHVMSKND